MASTAWRAPTSRCGRRMRRGSRCRRLQRLGRAPPPAASRGRRPGSGRASSPAWASGERYKYRLASTLGGDVARQGRPVRAAAPSSPPATASITHALVATRGATPPGCRRARRARQIGRADLDLRGAPRLVAARPRGGRRGSSRYRELAPLLIEYVQRFGFTHVELLPVMEHPYYRSWGYQLSGLLRPDGALRQRRTTSPRSSTSCISAGIGVILDWVPAHFPADAFALGRFDGTHLYEHADPRHGVHPDWQSLIFNYGRDEVRSLPRQRGVLLARPLPRRRAALRRGRVDAVPRLLAGRRRVGPEPPRWQREPRRRRAPPDVQRRDPPRTPRRDHDRRGVDVVARGHRARSPTAASASTSSGTSGGCTTPSTTSHKDPVHRRWHHDAADVPVGVRRHGAVRAPALARRGRAREGLAARRRWPATAPAAAREPPPAVRAPARPARQEAALHGRRVRPGRASGPYDAQPRLGPPLEHPGHAGIAALVAALNALYRDEPALHRDDLDDRGFALARRRRPRALRVLCVERHDGRGSHLVIACNATPEPRDGYLVGLPAPGRWSLRCSSDEARFGGSGHPAAASVLATSDGVARAALLGDLRPARPSGL